MSGEFYSEDDFRPQSPPLERVFVRAAPSPSPPPVVTQVFHPPVSSLSSRRRKKANRRKTRPTQGDLVLIREMDPNRPDIAQQASQHALNSDSDSAPEDDEEDMDDQPANSVAVPANHPTRSGAQPFSMQQPGKDTLDLPLQHAATVQHRDSVLEADIKSGVVVTNRRPSDEAVVDTLPNGSQLKVIDPSRSTPIITSTLPSTTTSPGRDQRNGSVSGLSPHDESLTTGTLRQLTIPPSRGLATDTLPALQPQSPPRDVASPNTQLPSISHMVGDLPRSASISEEGSRSNGFPHRQSVSSLGQSPTFRQLSISSHAHSPGTPFPPLSASSPISAASSVQRDPFLQSGGHIFGPNRRPSQASDQGRYPSNLQSGGSPSEGYQSSDGPSPGSQQTPIEGRPRHMSLDGALATNSAAIILPPPIGSAIQHIPMHGSGSFRCDYPGCNAAPFQTQYLLNSHTNVHSQNRPHYCPVEGCPRSEGGKGFKRKNEMIRHGLVHQSPGYVCPFCPDREHKYPRPDNLQRHVRVHHVNKDKDDPELREVLAQRPEGGSRGRRRRVSGV